MSALKSIHHCHVAWSRNQVDKFVAISNDVKLFEFTNQQQQQQQQQQTQHNHQQNSDPLVSYASGTSQGGNQGVVGGNTAKPKTRHHNQFVNSRLIATGPEISSFKAAACYPGSITDNDTLVAISCGGIQNTGKIVLVCLRPAGMYSIDNYVHVDLVAKRAICNDVDWSHVNNSLLATAWDRHKVDNSLQIFDINRIIETGKYSFNFSTTPNNRPVFDGCSGDSINSIKWFRKEQSVVCGVNSKQVKIFDIRDLTKAKLTTPTRAVHGLTVDSFTDKRFASYVDSTIYIWDSRFFDKPLVTIQETKPISQISWCPTRNYTFSALMAGDDFVKIYDIQQASLFSEDFEAKIVERLIHPFAQAVAAAAAVSAGAPCSTPSSSSLTAISGGGGGGFYDQTHMTGNFMSLQGSMNLPKQITSYDWHPTSEFRLIAISNTRDVIALNICDRITLNWSPICEIVWTKGKKILQCLDPRDERYKCLDDISVQMRHRAITNYGMIVEEGPHHQRGDDSDLIGLLRWVKLAKALDITSKKSKQMQMNTETGGDMISRAKDCTEILGVGSLLRDSINQTPSHQETKAINWKGAAATSCVMSPIRFQVYHSELRSRALLLCDWIPDIDNISQTIPIIDYLEKEGNYMRAAAIAVFNMRLQRAIESLTMGATRSDPNLSSVAMALSGYTGERTSMWREMCQSLKSQLTNPYMKAMFAFLTSDSDTSFHEIIYDKDLILADRVAFSLLYLPDDKLNIYLSQTMCTLVENGDLNGILLTGITHDGLSLLQRYIEISSDIQSVSLIVLHSLPSAICSDARAQLWVECYRGMLDCWRLWHQRAHFDNLWYSNSASSVKPPTNVLISCNYCGNTMSHKQSQQVPASSTSSSSQIGNQIQSSSSYSSNSNISQGAHQSMAVVVGHNNNQQHQVPAVTTTDYYQSQQVASSVPVTISGMSVSSFTSNSSISTVSSAAATAISTGTLHGLQSNSSPSAYVNSNSPAAAAAPAPSAASVAPAATVDVSNLQNSPTFNVISSGVAPKNQVKRMSHTPGGGGTAAGNLPASGSTIPGSGGRGGKNCSNCKKCSFAKCCLCLTQLGSNQILFDYKHFQRNKSSTTTTGSGNEKFARGQTGAFKTNPFSNWFSWCQTCRHGAHSAHLLSWFSENSECPVSGCDCKCMNLDSRTELDDVHKV